jgi:hypothetical protein
MSRKRNEFRCSSCNDLFDRGRFELWMHENKKENEIFVKVCLPCSNSMKKYNIESVVEYDFVSSPGGIYGDIKNAKRNDQSSC